MYTDVEVPTTSLIHQSVHGFHSHHCKLFLSANVPTKKKISLEASALKLYTYSMPIMVQLHFLSSVELAVSYKGKINLVVEPVAKGDN